MKRKQSESTMDFTPLIWMEPWLTPVVLNLEHVIETESVSTAAVTPDGKTLRYNPRFWESLGDKQKIAVQIHELLHIVGQHAKRRGTRLWETWNIACDMAINYQIASCGYRLPKGVLPGENDSAENIYQKLAAQSGGNGIEENGTEGNGTEGNGVVLSDDLLIRNEDGSDASAGSDTSEAVEFAFQIAGRGHTPLSRKFAPIPTKSDWRILLQMFVKSAIGDNCDYLSYEFDEFGVCEDILSPKPYWKICALVDESGSIGDELYEMFLGELGKMERFAEVVVSGFTDNTPFNAVPLEKYRRTMTGGTDVRRAYAEACRLQFDCIVVLTDGILASFPSSEPVPTIWVMPNSFGRKREVLL